MDFDLMITSFPKLLGATVVTLKLLSASLFFGLFLGLFFAILRLNKNIFIFFWWKWSNYVCCFNFWL